MAKLTYGMVQALGLVSLVLQRERERDEAFIRRTIVANALNCVLQKCVTLPTIGFPAISLVICSSFNECRSLCNACYSKTRLSRGIDLTLFNFWPIAISHWWKIPDFFIPNLLDSRRSTSTWRLAVSCSHTCARASVIKQLIWYWPKGGGFLRLGR